MEPETTKPIALVVDDHPVNRQVLHAALMSVADVHEACDGVEGLEKIEALSPDVVFLDIMMPRMDGLQVLDALRQHDPGFASRVIVVTASNEPTVREQVLSMGVHGFLPKPLMLDQIFSMLEALWSGGDEDDSEAAGAG